MLGERITITEVQVRGVELPLGRPLRLAGGELTSTPLVLIDLETDQGVGGCGYAFCYQSVAVKPLVVLLRGLSALLVGEELAPLAIEARLRRDVTLLGAQGLVGIALALLDTACWDAHAKAQGLPLVRLLGGTPQPVRAYNGCGLGLVGASAAATEAEALLEGGFRALKLRLGYPTLAEDLAVLRAVRGAVGDGVELMVDYNQCLSIAEAFTRVRALDDAGLAWIEEPTRADDFASHARIAAAARTPIQLGENCWGPSELSRALVAGASDYVMPDPMRIGGVTGWLRAAALAEAGGVPMSSCLSPELSAHLLGVTATAHWLEYADFAAPILCEAPRLIDGHVVPSEAPGHGMRWDTRQVERHRIA